MSQDFRNRYEQLRASDPTKPENASETTESGSFYETPGHSRNLCLVWPDGRRMFLSYAYLAAGKFAVESEFNIINLYFSLHTVTVKGYALESLFMQLLDQMPRLISESDSRYASSERHQCIIIEMIVSKNQD